MSGTTPDLSVVSPPAERSASVIRVYLKDGLTVYEFDDAAKFRALMHDQVGHKPRGGEPLEVVQLFRARTDDGRLTGGFYEGGKVKLRFLSKQSVSHVEEVPAA